MQNIPVILENLASFSISEIKSHLRFVGKKMLTLHVNDCLLYIKLNIDFNEAGSFMEVSYNITGIAVNQQIEIIFLKSNLKKGFVAYFICPISRDRCRKLYLYKNHFVGRKGIQGSRYHDQTVPIGKRESNRFAKRMNGIIEMAKASQQPYFMASYNGTITKRNFKLQNELKRLCTFS